MNSPDVRATRSVKTVSYRSTCVIAYPFNTEDLEENIDRVTSATRV